MSRYRESPVFSMTATYSSLIPIETLVNPAASASRRMSSTSEAPATQPTRASARSLAEPGNGRNKARSEMATRPPSLSTREISRQTWGLSGERLMTQLESTTSTLLSETGRCSISPRRNSTFESPVRSENDAALRRALESICAVMSTPMALPVGPTACAARNMSKPAPDPRSITVSPLCRDAMACGLPHDSPKLVPSGRVSRTAGS